MKYVSSYQSMSLVPRMATAGFCPSTLQLPSSCSPLLKAEAQNELCRTDQTPVSEKSGENDATRHSSAGGINGKNEWRRSAGLARRRPRSHRRTPHPKTRRTASLELDTTDFSA